MYKHIKNDCLQSWEHTLVFVIILIIAMALMPQYRTDRWVCTFALILHSACPRLIDTPRIDYIHYVSCFERYTKQMIKARGWRNYAQWSQGPRHFSEREINQN